MAKPSDIRLDVGFYRNLKTQKLIRALGSEGIIALQKLWIYAAEYHQDGDLTGVDDDDIDTICEWPPAHRVVTRFREDLIRLGWINSDGVTLRDWSVHQAWIVGAPARSVAARTGAAARHAGGPQRTASGSPAKGGRVASGKQKSAMPPSPPTPSLPNPPPPTDEQPVGGSSRWPQTSEVLRTRFGVATDSLLASCLSMLPESLADDDCAWNLPEIAKGILTGRLACAAMAKAHTTAGTTKTGGYVHHEPPQDPQCAGCGGIGAPEGHWAEYQTAPMCNPCFGAFDRKRGADAETKGSE